MLRDYTQHRLKSVASVQENLTQVALFEGMWYAGGERSGYNTVARNKGHGLGRKRGCGLGPGK